MFIRRILPLMCVVVLAWLGTGLADDAMTLVFRDGSSLLAESAEVRGGAVIVRLPNGRFQQYEVADVDLAASGLLGETPAEEPAAERQEGGLAGGGNFGKAIAPESESASSVTITDDDVAHVSRPAKRDRGEEDDGGEAAEEVSDGEGALRLANVRQVVGADQVMVTGQVVNDGVLDLSGIVVVARAQDIEGSVIGEGTVGIGKTLGPGAVHAFSLVIPVNGETADVVLSGSALAPPRPRALPVDVEASEERADGEGNEGEDAPVDDAESQDEDGE